MVPIEYICNGMHFQASQPAIRVFKYSPILTAAQKNNQHLPPILRLSRIFFFKKLCTSKVAKSSWACCFTASAKIQDPVEGGRPGFC